MHTGCAGVTMRKRTMRWPEGTGQFERMQTVVVSSDPRHRMMVAACGRPDTMVVATPLEVIARLEADVPIATVVVTPDHPGNEELAAFLRESYPLIEVIG